MSRPSTSTFEAASWRSVRDVSASLETELILARAKLAWSLQGSFGRIARNLIEQGICTE
jgi:hypothetical protein